MTAVQIARLRHTAFAMLVATLVMTFTTDAFAQRAGGGPRKRPSRDNKQPPPKQEKTGAPSPGRTEGTIYKFTPADEDDLKEDEKMVGTLKIRPFEEGARVLTLLVRDTEDLKIMLGDHEFEHDEMTFYFQKHLHVEVDWGYLNPDSKRKNKKKELRSLRFQTTEIEAEVEEVRDIGVEVRGVPLNKQQWPGYNPPDRNKPPGTQEEERIIPRTLKLKFIEDITKVRNEENEEADMGDFKEGDKVRVTAVYAGSKIGMLVALRPPNVADVSTPDKAPPPRDGRGKPGGRRGRPGRPSPQG